MMLETPLAAPAEFTAFGEGIQGSAYLGNSFAGLSATKVLPQA